MTPTPEDKDPSVTDGAATNQWARLGSAVPRTGPIDVLAEIPAETGAMPAVPPATEGAGQRAGAERNRDDSGQPRRADARGPRQGTAVARILTRVIVGLAVPLGLLAVSVRLVATPVFLWVEYHRPGFPEDPYGFTADDRMTLGSHGVDYILNWAPPSFLGSLRTPNGVAWFRPDEISHMTDVKYVMQLGLGFGFLMILLALAIMLIRRNVDATGLIRAAVRGAWSTLGLIVVLGIVAVLAWQWFFETFHALFFDDGTWTFSLSDTLIRLYPTQFWIDAAACVGVLTIIGAIVIILTGRRALRRRPS